MAQKSAEMLGRPVPKLDRTISKIMNVVWVHPTEEAQKKMRRIKFDIFNYTGIPRSFRIHMQLPMEAVNDTVKGKSFVDINDEGKATWEVLDLEPAGNTSITFDLIGDMCDVFSTEEVYISGVNPVIVMGAEPLPGDWGIKGMEITEYDADLDEDSDDDDESEEEGLDDDE